MVLDQTDLEKMILQRVLELKLDVDAEGFSKSLAELTDVFSAHVQALGAKYKIGLTVTSNFRIETLGNVIDLKGKKKKPRKG